MLDWILNTAVIYLKNHKKCDLAVTSWYNSLSIEILDHKSNATAFATIIFITDVTEICVS